MMPTAGPRARGYMIFEMMVALGILAFFALLATALFGNSMKLVREGAATQDRLARYDAAVAELRRDVWSATQIETPAPGTARLTLADGSVAEWVTDDQGGLTRTLAGAGDDGAGEPARRAWSAAAPGLTFRESDGVLFLIEQAPRRAGANASRRPQPAPAGPTREVPLVSQMVPRAGGPRP